MLPGHSRLVARDLGRCLCLFLVSLAAACGETSPADARGILGAAFVGTTAPLSAAGIAGVRELTIHPFGHPGGVLEGAFNSLSLGGGDFHRVLRTAVSSALGTKLRDIELELDTVESSPLRSRLRLSHGGVELLGYEVVGSRLSDHSSFLVLGSLPELAEGAASSASSDWPQEDSLRSLVEAGGTPIRGEAFSLVGPAKKYYAVRGGELIPVLSQRLVSGQRPYRVVGDGLTIISFEPDFFELDGSGLVVPFTIEDEPVPTLLRDLVGGGTLTTPYLQSVPQGQTPAFEASGTFNYEKGDPRFDEVQAFSHTQGQFEWLRDLGAEWYGPRPMQIKINAVISGSINNALFIPGSEDDGTLPSINVGRGDGRLLANLTTDAGVVRHEYSHFVVYKTLKKSTGESLVLHEGLADSFVFLHYDDPCLGHSICPLGSRACQVATRCIRSADNSLSYLDASWKQWEASQGGLGHRHGQLLSGLLWDLRKNREASTEDIAAMTYRAVSFLKFDSGLRDFLISLLTANRDLFQCRYDEPLRRHIRERNLDVLIPDVAAGCQSLPAVPASTQEPAQGGGGENPGAKQADKAPGDQGGSKKKGHAKCGTVTGEDSARGHPFVIAAILLAPLLLPLSFRLNFRTFRPKKLRRAEVK